MSGRFTLSLSQDEFVSAYWFYTRWLWLWRRMTLAFALVTLIYTGLMIAIDGFTGELHSGDLLSYFASGAIYALIVSAALILITLVTLPRRLKRIYGDLRVAGRETRFEFDTAGLRTENSDGTSKLDWNRFKHSIENDRFVMFVLSRWSFIIIPKAQVDGAILAELRKAAAAGGVNNR